MGPPSHGASWPYLLVSASSSAMEGSVHLLRPSNSAALVVTGGVQLHCLLVDKLGQICVLMFESSKQMPSRRLPSLSVGKAVSCSTWRKYSAVQAGKRYRLARALRKVLGGRFADSTAAQPSAAAGCRCRGLRPLAAAPLRSRTCSVGLHRRPCVLVWLLGLGLQCKHAPFRQITRVRRQITKNTSHYTIHHPFQNFPLAWPCHHHRYRGPSPCPATSGCTATHLVAQRAEN